MGVPCHPCDGERSWASGSATASAAVRQSAWLLANTAADARAGSGKPRRNSCARGAARTASYPRQPAGVCCAHAAARDAVIRCAPPTRPCAGTAGAATPLRPRRRPVRGAAGPACCGSRPAGAAPVLNLLRRASRRGSAPPADSCVGTPGWACARPAGSVTRTARSSARKASRPGWSTRRRGSTSSSAISPSGTALPVPACSSAHSAACLKTRNPTTRRRCSSTPADPAGRWARWPAASKTSSPAAGWPCALTKRTGWPPGAGNAASTQHQPSCARPSPRSPSRCCAAGNEPAGRAPARQRPHRGDRGGHHP